MYYLQQVAALEQLHKEQLNQQNGTPLVWVHDYHLMLAANWIRQAAEDKNLRLKLGFFLHIPFPPWDIFRLFPWADEILQGMLGTLMIIEIGCNEFTLFLLIVRL